MTKNGNSTKAVKGKNDITIFPSLRILVFCAMLAGISYVIGCVCKSTMNFGGGALRITFENLPVLLSSILFGPICGTIVGALSDILSAVSTGQALNPIITVGAASVGLVSGIFSQIVFKGKMNALKQYISVMSGHLIGSMIIKTIALRVFFGYEYVILIWRIPLYLCIGAVEFYLIHMLLKNKAVQKEIKRIKG